VLLNGFKAHLQASLGIVNEQLEVMVMIICCFEALAMEPTLAGAPPFHSVSDLPRERCQQFEEM
jgi:hypothetical protein